MHKNKGKKILVPGGNGFIGRHLIGRLLNLGYKVCVVGRTDLRLDEHKDLSFIRADVKDKDLSLKLPKDVNIIVHLAGKFSPTGYLESASDFYETNIMGTENLLEYACKIKVEHFVFTSSCYVYGDMVKLPFNENSRILPNSPLGATKAASEYLTYVYHRCFDVPSTILRIFTVYGPHASEKHFTPLLIKEMFYKKDVRLGSPDNTRDFIYIDDVVDAFIKVLTVKNPSCEIFNVGTGKETTIREAVETLKKLIKGPVGQTVVFNTKEKRPDERNRRSRMCADISKIRRKLRWKPTFDLKNGLIKTIPYYTER